MIIPPLSTPSSGWYARLSVSSLLSSYISIVSLRSRVELQALLGREGPLFWREGPLFWREGPLFWRGGQDRPLSGLVEREEFTMLLNNSGSSSSGVGTRPFLVSWFDVVNLGCNDINQWQLMKENVYIWYSGYYIR